MLYSIDKIEITF